MRALAAQGPRAIVLTSGTLAPLGSFAAELGLPFPITLENPHVVPASQARARAAAAAPCSPVHGTATGCARRAAQSPAQVAGPRHQARSRGAATLSSNLTNKAPDVPHVWAGVVPVGPCGVPLNSSFATRDTQKYKEDLGRAPCRSCKHFVPLPFPSVPSVGHLLLSRSRTLVRWRSSSSLLDEGTTELLVSSCGLMPCCCGSIPTGAVSACATCAHR